MVKDWTKMLNRARNFKLLLKSFLVCNTADTQIREKYQLPLASL